MSSDIQWNALNDANKKLLEPNSLLVYDNTGYGIGVLDTSDYKSLYLSLENGNKYDSQDLGEKLAFNIMANNTLRKVYDKKRYLITAIQNHSRNGDIFIYLNELFDILEESKNNQYIIIIQSNSDEQDYAGIQFYKEWYELTMTEHISAIVITNTGETVRSSFQASCQSIYNKNDIIELGTPPIGYNYFNKLKPLVDEKTDKEAYTIYSIFFNIALHSFRDMPNKMAYYHSHLEKNLPLFSAVKDETTKAFGAYFISILDVMFPNFVNNIRSIEMIPQAIESLLEKIVIPDRYIDNSQKTLLSYTLDRLDSEESGAITMTLSSINSITGIYNLSTQHNNSDQDHSELNASGQSSVPTSSAISQQQNGSNQSRILPNIQLTYDRLHLEKIKEQEEEINLVSLIIGSLYKFSRSRHSNSKDSRNESNSPINDFNHMEYIKLSLALDELRTVQKKNTVNYIQSHNNILTSFRGKFEKNLNALDLIRYTVEDLKLKDEITKELKADILNYEKLIESFHKKEQSIEEKQNENNQVISLTECEEEEITNIQTQILISDMQAELNMIHDQIKETYDKIKSASSIYILQRDHEKDSSLDISNYIATKNREIKKIHDRIISIVNLPSDNHKQSSQDNTQPDENLDIENLILNIATYYKETREYLAEQCQPIFESVKEIIEASIRFAKQTQQRWVEGRLDLVKLYYDPKSYINLESENSGEQSTDAKFLTAIEQAELLALLTELSEYATKETKQLINKLKPDFQTAVGETRYIASELILNDNIGYPEKEKDETINNLSIIASTPAISISHQSLKSKHHNMISLVKKRDEWRINRNPENLHFGIDKDQIFKSELKYLFVPSEAVTSQDHLKKVFLCYSRGDVDIANKIMSFADSSYVKREHIKFLSDSLLVPGDNWTTGLATMIDMADVYYILISAESLNRNVGSTAYIRDFEIPRITSWLNYTNNSEAQTSNDKKVLFHFINNYKPYQSRIPDIYGEDLSIRSRNEEHVNSDMDHDDLWKNFMILYKTICNDSSPGSES